MPHQLEPALAIVQGLCTRVLLADEVGLGKTIEAGLILSELRARGAVSRALLLTPAGLRSQWQDELSRRFAIPATIADAATLRASAAMFSHRTNPWQLLDVAIASTDLVKRPEHLRAVLTCAWDVLIVDEAHNAATDTERRAAVDAVARRTPYVVLLTATPHNGDPAAFDALCDIGSLAETIAVFRRSRRDVNLAVSRRTIRLLVVPTAAERRMHRALADLTRALTREHGDRSPAVWLALTVLNKRALSSAWALHRTVTKRLEMLSAESTDAVQVALPFADPDGELDSSDDAPEWTGGPALPDAAQERRLLEAVQRAAADAARGGESKIAAIRRWLRRVREPAIVFSEYRDTIRHVVAHLDVPALELHGGMSPAERAAVVTRFAAPDFNGVLLATDAAGEGLNLHQRCRVVISLELPWNPVRLEQRIGRVDRIGQRRTVHALALVGRGTPEIRVLARLRDRIARARSVLGTADPLHIVTERDIERVVLGYAKTPRGDSQESAALFSPKLRGEADAEVARARVHRRVLPPRSDHHPHLAADRPLIATSRAAHTRKQLRNTALLLVEATLEDGAGSVVERELITFRSTDWRLLTDCVDSGSLPPGLDEFGREWAIRAEAFWRSFAKARLTREQQIVTAVRAEPVTASAQGGLFDRRAERAAAAARAIHDAAVDVLSRRSAAFELCLTSTAHRLVLRLVIAGRR